MRDTTIFLAFVLGLLLYIPGAFTAPQSMTTFEEIGLFLVLFGFAFAGFAVGASVQKADDEREREGGKK